MLRAADSAYGLSIASFQKGCCGMAVIPQRITVISTISTRRIVLNGPPQDTQYDDDDNESEKCSDHDYSSTVLTAILFHTYPPHSTQGSVGATLSRISTLFPQLALSHCHTATVFFISARSS